ncbi:MAG TPA: carbohydrate ABC transporter permease, partial [Clostridia bacterium]|nr:carbohydrate ABC transporter permease [Clostridia bacterium]
IVNAFVMILLTFLFFYPLWETVVRSFSTPETASSLGIKLWPSAWTADAYRHVLRNPDFLVGFRNTLLRTAAGTALAVAITFCGG